MKFVPPETCLEDYKKRRSAFLKELIASTPNVSLRAKELRRGIDENPPYSDNDEGRNNIGPNREKDRGSVNGRRLDDLIA